MTPAIEARRRAASTGPFPGDTIFVRAARGGVMSSLRPTMIWAHSVTLVWARGERHAWRQSSERQSITARHLISWERHR
jgi:hypothetical protein